MNGEEQGNRWMEMREKLHKTLDNTIWNVVRRTQFTGGVLSEGVVVVLCTISSHVKCNTTAVGE